MKPNQLSSMFVAAFPNALLFAATIFLVAGVGCGGTVKPAVRPDDSKPDEATSAAADVQTTSRFRFLSAEEAGIFLGETDGFTTALSTFDRNIRMKTADPVSDAQFRMFIAGEARAFDEAEKEALRQHIATIEAAVAELSLSFPKEILLIKTTGNEELGAAGYTRRNAIVLREAKADRVSIGLLAHELFHVLSSHSPALRKRAYGLMDFRPCSGGPIPAELEVTRLTNPDAYEASCAMISKAGESSARFPVLTVGASLQEALAEKNLFNALKVRLLPEGSSSGAAWLSTETDFHQKLAKNSGYTIHPEEVLADNFSIWIRSKGVDAKPVADPAFLERFAIALGKPATP